MNKTPTPHIGAEKDQIAKTVLMPGDPLRAKYIAENFLENYECVNQVRNMLAFTGEYQGKRITVAGGGMGMPSVGIYTYELFHFYEVDQIIRIGTAGTLSDKVRLRDVVVGIGASTDSSYAAQYHLPGTFAPIADFELARKAVETGERLGIRTVAGNILSSDLFYNDHGEDLTKWVKMGILAVEMEAAALYMNAARAGKKALCMLTISDAPLRSEALSAEERQTGFTDMMKIALETA
ncbi:purine-nucleoside phosphorylase [bacterium C-53]|nr:purine-nucleoside phosphorylase [Lachnospiraceae bacterium]NBI01480.1 purine-nucleoside phosphorylase [Lachnospiraceae bacterium]RKJ12788.1 purine-nucleoside phosphorylase [bacterium C-53]